MDSKLLLLGLLAIAGTGILLLSNNKAAAAPARAPLTVAAFAEFRARHGKTYASLAEAEYRFGVFQQTLEKINAHNADPTQTYTQGVNQFSDLTWPELEAFYLADFSGVNGNAKCERTKFDLSLDLGDDEPKDVDWQKAEKVRAVKDQKRCGSCWAFAANGALESAYAIFKNELPDLAEQELVDCSRSYGNHGCHGGLMHYAYDYILDHKINVQTEYPYEGRDGRCNKDKSGKGTHTLKGCAQVQQDVKAIVKALVKQPVAVAFHVQEDFFRYKEGIYNPEGCKARPNHAVLAVGYHVEEDAKKSFFLVKNSWATKWGDKGYFKIAIGEGKGTCNIAGTPWNYFPTL